jgi:hypothetical protein
VQYTLIRTLDSTPQRSFPGQEVSKTASKGAQNGTSCTAWTTSNPTNSAPLPHLPSLSPLLQAQNIASPKWLPTTYAPGLSKTATYAAYCMDRFNYKYGRPSYFLLASSLLQHANRPHNFLTQPPLNYLSLPKDRLPPARFCSHF